MFGFLIILEVLIAVLLIVVILMQASKGGGLAGTFGGGGGSVGMVFGLRRTADFLIRATQILAGAFIVLALVINMFFLPRVENAKSILQQSSQPQSVPTTPQLPPTQPPLNEPPALPE